MKRQHLIFVAALTGLIATAAESPAQQTPGWAAPYGEAMQVAGRNLFQEHCIFCHALKPGGRHFGPSLYGIAGRTAGTDPGFPYSEALRKSGIVWTDENLRKWIAGTTNLVPSTLMPHTTVSDPAEQLYLVAYLKSLKAPPAHK
jgi:cytochrome c